jgi:hypothetical protein
MSRIIQEHDLTVVTIAVSPDCLVFYASEYPLEESGGLVLYSGTGHSVYTTDLNRFFRFWSQVDFKDDDETPLVSAEELALLMDFAAKLPDWGINLFIAGEIVSGCACKYMSAIGEHRFQHAADIQELVEVLGSLAAEADAPLSAAV